MAGVTLDQLPPVVALNGNELFWIYQQGGNLPVPWVGYNVTLNQILQYAFGGTLGGCTMRQLLAALDAQGVLTEVSNAVPSDITDGYNIAWNKAARMTLTDPFTTGFLQPTLGYTNDQMASLFNQALAYPA
jgi:hypothetical protein